MERFDELFVKEVEKRKDRGEADEKILDNKENDIWVLPSQIIVFLTHSITNIHQVKLRLLPWVDFKK